MDIYRNNLNNNQLIPNPYTDITNQNILLKSYPYPCFLPVAPYLLSFPIANYNNVNVDRQLYRSIPKIPNKPLYYQSTENSLYSQAQNIRNPTIQNKPLHHKNTGYPLYNISPNIDNVLYNKTFEINSQTQGIVKILYN